MEMLTPEQAAKLTPDQLTARQAEKVAEQKALRDANRAQAMVAIETLECDDDGVPYVKIRADAVGAWQTVMFWSQQLRNAGDTVGRAKYGAIAHGFELGYWKE